jgi:Co/Zn/Cd efflux system component
MADPHRGKAAYRRVLWAVLAINAVMFAVEIGAGLAAGSAALQADALDFLGDAANYGISLFVVGMALRHHAMAALAKGGTMGVFGLWVIATVLWHATHGTLPSAFTMGAVGFAALAANAASFGLLWAHRGGDANMRSAFARAMTCSATWPFCWQRLVCSASARAGPTSSSPRSWRALRCKAR